MSTPDNDTIYTTMLQALVIKYGLVLTTDQCAETLGISTRTLDERRKQCKDCPEYITQNGKRIHYPVQKVVEYQLQKTQESIKVA
jgi:hypothetical protein